MLETILDCLNEMQASDILSLDVKNITSITDTMVICTARSKRHLQASADKLIMTCKKAKITAHPSNLESDEWIIIDCFDVIVHIMVKEARDFYQLEKLWALHENTAHNEN